MNPTERTSALKVAALLVLGLSLTACGGRTNVESDLGISGAPDWVNEGTQAVSDKDGRLIQGVGMAAPMGDMSLQKSTADNRARAEIARILSTYIDATIEDFSASSGGELDASVERTIRGQTQQALSGARILGHWKDKKTGTIYSFAELDMKEVDKTLGAAGELAEGFKDYYSQQAASGFSRFVEEKSE